MGPTSCAVRRKKGEQLELYSSERGSVSFHGAELMMPRPPFMELMMTRSPHGANDASASFHGANDASASFHGANDAPWLRCAAPLA